MTSNTVSHLDTLVQRAISMYPAEAARIERGAAIVRMGGVTWNASGMALVAGTEYPSDTAPTKAYPVGKKCPCYDALYNAPNHRCKHRWAKCLASKLYHGQHGAEHDAAQWLPTRYHATYGEDSGVVVAQVDGSVWFQADGTQHWLPVSLAAVVLHGVVETVAV